MFKYLKIFVFTIFLTNYSIISKAEPVTTKIPYAIESFCNDDTATKLIDRVQKAIIEEHHIDYPTESHIFKFRQSNQYENRILINFKCDTEKGMLFDKLFITVTWFLVENGNNKIFMGSTNPNHQKDTFYHIKKGHIEIINANKKILKNHKIIP